MPSTIEILEYIDDLIDAEACIPSHASEYEKALAVGIIMALENLKDWIKAQGII